MTSGVMRRRSRINHGYIAGCALLASKHDMTERRRIQPVVAWCQPAKCTLSALEAHRCNPIAVFRPEF
jgi:hypothetical protein